MLPYGDVAAELNEQEVLDAAQVFKARGIGSVIVCFLYSFLNDTHERRAKALIQSVLPDAYVSCSSEVVNVIRGYERFSTTAMNAFVGPKTALYLNNLEGKLRDAGINAHLRIMQSNGGVSTVEMCAQRPVSILMSGLAGGVMGGCWAGAMSDVRDVITVDIGGTSVDFSTIPDGQVKIMNPRDTYVGSYSVLASMIDMATMGAGGGSIAYLDEGGAFRVGPRSAGADPGPACYGRGGTEPTVTDAQVVLGRLDPDQFLGGVKIDQELAHRAIEEKIARPLGMSVTEAALGIIRILNSNMSFAIRANSVVKSFDPRRFALLPFGGAGPLNGVALAEAVSAREVIVPPAPDITAAIGLLVTDMQYEFTRSVLTVLDNVTEEGIDKINGVIDELTVQCRTRLEAHVVPAYRQHYVRVAECRYTARASSCADMPDGVVSLANVGQLKTNFRAQHKRDYGWAFDDVEVEIVTLRVIGVAKTPALQWPPLSTGSTRPTTAR